MNKTDKNIQVLHRFRETLKNKRIVGGGSWVFSAHAVLEYNGKRIDDEVEVSIWFDAYGDESCSVNLQVSDKIDPEKHYAQFKPKYQDFELIGGDELLISDTNSPRLGDYTITLIPYN